MVAVSQPVPQNRAGRGDRFFRSIVQICASLNILLLIAIVIELVVYSLPSIQKFGLDFFTKSVWNPTGTDTNPVVFGALAFIFGTIVTAVVGLIIATPLAIGASIFISEYCPPRIGDLIAFFIELLVAIPSVAYGVWGLFVLAPFMRFTVDPFLENTLGRIPVIGAIFQPQIVNGHSRPITGTDIFTAGVILAIMILPTILAVSREVIRQVPRLQKEGMIALGATKWESIRIAVLPYARTGIIGAALLGLARALGETMAVTMVIGNSSTAITPSLFSPGYTLSSAIANQFTEAIDPLYFSAVIELGLALLVVALFVNLLSRWLIGRSSSKISLGLIT